MQQITLWKRLRKHYILLLVGLVALLITVAFGVYRVIHPQGATPIAHISAQDSLKTTTLPTKLESYKKELIEQEKQAYSRKVALDEIVSMDFSQELKLKGAQKPKDAHQVEKGLENPHKPLDDMAKKQETQNAELAVAQKIKKPLRRESRKVGGLKGEGESKDGFFIIKIDDADSQHIEKRDNNTFIKALIHGNQKLNVGDRVCLRLAEEAAFGGEVFAKNTILYGRIKGGMSGRIGINISQVKQAKVNLSVYDGDYSEGIGYQMRERVSEVARESRDDALNEVLSSLPYGGVAGGLTQLGRNVSRKTKPTNTVYLADGYEIYIAQAK